MTNAPKAEVFKIAEMVAYQVGAVVSRQITKEEAGNVTLFAFDKGQELSEHSAPYDALVHVLEGDVEIKIAGRSHHLKGGEAIIMPANQPHALRALEKIKLILTMIRM